MAIRDQGLVSQVFDENMLRSLVGDMAIGHVRYSTTGSSEWENAQPIVRDDRRTLALAHNGNLINAVELHAELRGRDVPFQSTSDSEIIAALLATHPAERIEDAVADVLPRLSGAFSTVVMTEDAVVAFRDPQGLRPLAHRPDRPAGGLRRAAGVLRGQRVVRAGPDRGDAICARSLPGEVVTLSADGLSSRQVVQARAPRLLRVRVHLLRPPGLADGRHRPAGGPRADGREPVARGPGRRRRGDPGARLRQRRGPRSGPCIGAATDDGFIKNRYVARTFIQPGQELRRQGVRMKFNPVPEVVAGKRLIVVDDSIVRGTTDRQIVQMLRDAGAAEVHLRISAPPIKHPCHYGIDMSTREEMIAHGRTVEEIAAELGADSLHYLSLQGVYDAIGGSRAEHCDACFSGEYPLAGTEGANGKYALEHELPLARV